MRVLQAAFSRRIFHFLFLYLPHSSSHAAVIKCVLHSVPNAITCAEFSKVTRHVHLFSDKKEKS